MTTKTQKHNEQFVENFARPQPIAKTIGILREWMGTGHTAVDIGCGSGYYTELCRECGNQVVGIDLTSQVRAAKARGLHVCLGDIEGALPFRNDTFDLALCSEVVEHLLQPDRMLADIRRILKPGGVLLLTTPNYGYWVLRLLYLYGQPPVGLPIRHFRGIRARVEKPHEPAWRDPHIRLFTPAILQSFLAVHGFRLDALRSTFVAFPSGITPYMPWLPGLPLRIAGKLIGNLDFLGDTLPSLLSAGILAKATRLE